ncbi:UPF0462 protein C4orf33 homolog isoform X1 [Nerophis lumbriciformis]|uniref:UPF0462 protein C4orf33 homolog isoform X1 n=1 Tax=Nerophis lumbriciformis TaxID=546530 RepID=UPI002AE02DEE|nr:UPF0462 protein C4orf33 homolog isoform X1 [Nerophis lumbriciformis]
MQIEYEIQHTWDSNPVNHEPIRMLFSPGVDGVNMKVFAPFFNDPEAPSGPSGQPFPGLWDYEVVESFFLDSTTENYLEVEVCPHGQHLILLLSGARQAFQQQLPMVFNATITADRWMGEALLPWTYFPPNVNKMNSYAIHGSGEKRTYEALYPIPKEEIVEGQQPNLLEMTAITTTPGGAPQTTSNPDSDLTKVLTHSPSMPHQYGMHSQQV